MVSVSVVNFCVCDEIGGVGRYKDVVDASALFVAPSRDIWGGGVEVGYNGCM